MNAELLRRFEQARAGRGVLSLAWEMKDEGQSQVAIYCAFEAFRAVLNDDNDDVLDTMDYICGFCSPGTSLFDHSLDNAEIEAHRREMQD